MRDYKHSHEDVFCINKFNINFVGSICVSQNEYCNHVTTQVCYIGDASALNIREYLYIAVIMPFYPVSGATIRKRTLLRLSNNRLSPKDENINVVKPSRPQGQALILLLVCGN